MEDKGSVTHWIHAIKTGESAAASALWERYFEKLVRLARGKLDGMPRRIADEEDVALGRRLRRGWSLKTGTRFLP